MKISIITAVFNRGATIGAAIDSVLQQSSNDIEYIVVDGMSNDDTERIVRSYSDRIQRYIREKDDGIYDALNKGIEAATGDVIGFLHADDMLASTEAISNVIKMFESTDTDATFANLWYVQLNDPTKVVRRWIDYPYDREKFRYGWMPAHPTFYLRREHYQKYGNYLTDFSIAADYELMIRMLFKNRLTAAFVDEVLVKMRVGGKSNASLGNRLLANREDANAWRRNGLRPPLGLRFMKPIRKIGQYFKS